METKTLIILQKQTSSKYTIHNFRFRFDDIVRGLSADVSEGYHKREQGPVWKFTQVRRCRKLPHAWQPFGAADVGYS